MNRSYEVEYCNLELRFDRGIIQGFIKALIQEGYSLYWNESDHQLLISVRTGRRLVKLKFQKIVDRFKMIGDYCFRDEKLSEMLEKLIGDTRGHAVVKRFKDRQILVENIMFGEMIRQVEISGVEHKVLFEKEPIFTVKEMIKAFKSNRVEERIPELRVEIDDELERLYKLLESGQPKDIEKCKRTLKQLSREMLLLEM